MEEPIAPSDSSEDLYFRESSDFRENTESEANLYSVSTSYTDIFDFTSANTFEEAEGVLGEQTSKIANFLKLLTGSFRFIFLGTFKISFEFLAFSFTFLNYLRVKGLQLVEFLDLSKDQIVSTLMWRRGLLFRPATHGGVVVVTAIAIVAGGLFTRGQIAAQDLTPGELVLQAANTTTTIVPTDRPRSEVITYKVEGGDTLSNLAEKFGVSVDSIKWVNAMVESDTIRPEDTLKIPPVSGVVHKVKETDTLQSLAKLYAADTQTIADFPFNYIDDTLSLKVGKDLFIPNGVIPRPVEARPAPVNRGPTNFAVSGSGLFSMPTRGVITQYFSWWHPALDIAADYGTPIYAAASGRVIDSKKQTYSFGWYCIIDHGNGYTSAYAHMSDLACSVGQFVEKGQYLGAVGTTGRATGPHLHFEVRRNGGAVNPLSVL